MSKQGRPSKFSTLDMEQVEMLCKAGFTDKQMAAFFKVTEQTFNNWKKANPSFFESLKDWKAEADAKVEKSLYERACGYKHKETKIFCNGEGKVTMVETDKHYPPDATSMIFWLKNRKPAEWRESLNVVAENPLDDLSDEEALAAARKAVELAAATQQAETAEENKGEDS